MNNKRYKITEISDIVKGQLLQKGKKDVVIQELLIDSRQLLQAESTLFFALKTKQGNGHKYVLQLYEKGVRNFVISETHALVFDLLKDATIILVEDSQRALQSLAAYHRSQFSYPVIAITGSNGKTVVKEWLQYVLQDHFEIIRSPKSYNSQVGVPLSVWQMSDKNNLAIFEAGISEVGEMSHLREIIQPDIGIYTNIGEAHSENFINRTQKAGEKLGLFTHIKTLIFCNDYGEISNAIGRSGLQKHIEIIDWSQKNDALLKILNIEKNKDKTLISFRYQNRQLQFFIPFIDDASIENSLHVLTTALYLKLPFTEIQSKMKSLPSIAMRLEMKEGINQCMIINDTYNSDLNSLKIALNFLNQQFAKQKKTLILSDILQSRKSEGELYDTIAQLLQRKGVSKFIGIGKAINLRKKAFEIIDEVFFFEDTEHFLREFDADNFREEGILIKGSRIFGFERISKVLQQKAHQTVMEINLQALIENLNYYRSKLLPETKVMIMVKAFSYGSGSFEIANILQYHHADYLCVAYTDEGVELRKSGIKLPIMVMNPDIEGFDHILQYDLEPEIYSFAILEQFEKALSNYPEKNKVKIHIKLDTGMHRLGFLESEIPRLAKHLAHRQDLLLASVFSHLAAADNPQDDNFTRHQYVLLDNMASILHQRLHYPFLKHILNTAGISRFPEAQMDMVRLGIGLYGVETIPAEKGKLQNVSSMKTIISQIKTISKDESVGYDRSFVAKKEMRIAIVPVGYADGLRRSLSNGKGSLFVNEKPARILGKICMDMTMIDVSNIDCQEGDRVVIFDENHPVTELAQKAETIPYEILTGISKRVKRIYFQE